MLHPRVLFFFFFFIALLISFIIYLFIILFFQCVFFNLLFLYWLLTTLSNWLFETFLELNIWDIWDSTSRNLVPGGRTISASRGCRAHWLVGVLRLIHSCRLGIALCWTVCGSLQSAGVAPADFQETSNSDPPISTFWWTELVVFKQVPTTSSTFRLNVLL